MSRSSPVVRCKAAAAAATGSFDAQALNVERIASERIDELRASTMEGARDGELQGDEPGRPGAVQ